ncbi:hypothetical protein, partial [Salmonella enterica]|uniref:hypothetical protein n=1 Tax=Salmonella enterica TaxID=28901 RepID=UPI001CD80505
RFITLHYASLRFIKIGKPGKKIKTLTSQVNRNVGSIGKFFPGRRGVGQAAGASVLLAGVGAQP